MKKLLVLVVIGVAVKYFLDSEKGDELKSYVRDLLGDAQDTFNEFFSKTSDKIEDTANDVDSTLSRTMG